MVGRARFSDRAPRRLCCRGLKDGMAREAQEPRKVDMLLIFWPFEWRLGWGFLEMTHATYHQGV